MSIRGSALTDPDIMSPPSAGDVGAVRPGARATRRRFPRVIRRFRGISGPAALFILLVATTAVHPHLISAHDPTLIQGNAILEPPGTGHFFGTDEYGRDVLSRVAFGARTSLRFALFATSISITASTVVGVFAAYYSGRFDTVVMRLVDVLMAFPGILLALIVVALLGPGLGQATVAVGFGQAPTFIRVVRSSALGVRHRLYVEAARALGVSSYRILWRHLFPNIRHTVLVLATLGFAEAILIGASLSFLGLGAQPPTPEWGAMLGEARGYLASAWWTAALPGGVLAATLLSLNIVGDQVRDLLDPRLR
jgi:ABC-type dipeptide/oligopeptide/nickel transport system permease subunit